MAIDPNLIRIPGFLAWVNKLHITGIEVDDEDDEDEDREGDITVHGTGLVVHYDNRADRDAILSALGVDVETDLKPTPTLDDK